MSKICMFCFRIVVNSQVPKFSFFLRLKMQISLASTVNSICEHSAHGDRTLEERTAGRKAHTGTSCILGCHESHLQHWHFGPYAESAVPGQQCQAMPALWDVPQTALEGLEPTWASIFLNLQWHFSVKSWKCFFSRMACKHHHSYGLCFPYY